MADILENSLVMVILAALILIPVFIVRLNNKKKKQALIQSKLDRITSDNNFKLVQTERVGNLLVAISDNQKLLTLNLVDFTFELTNLENAVSVKKDISYNSKEIKNVKLLLTFKNGATKDIQLYKQFADSEGSLSAIHKFADKWILLLGAPV